MGKSSCCTCGYEWLTGKGGSHSCVTQLKKNFSELEDVYIKVLYHATGGSMSKAYDDVDQICSVIDDHVNDLISYELKEVNEMIKEGK